MFFVQCCEMSADLFLICQYHWCIVSNVGSILYVLFVVHQMILNDHRWSIFLSCHSAVFHDELSSYRVQELSWTKRFWTKRKILLQVKIKWRVRFDIDKLYFGGIFAQCLMYRWSQMHRYIHPHSYIIFICKALAVVVVVVVIIISIINIMSSNIITNRKINPNMNITSFSVKMQALTREM